MGSYEPPLRANAVYGEGRVCVTKDCITILCHFNPGPACYECQKAAAREDGKPDIQPGTIELMVAREAVDVANG